MREIRTYGSEGGEAKASPTPIVPRTVGGARARSADGVPAVGLPSLVLGPGILPGRRPAVTLTGQSAPGFPAGIMIKAQTWNCCSQA